MHPCSNHSTACRALVPAVLGLLAAFGTPAPADEVVFKTGGRLEGKAFVEAGSVRVEVEGGVLVFPEALVAEIVPGLAPVERAERERRGRDAWVRRQVDALDPRDAPRLFAVALDARRRGFPAGEVRALLGLVLGADPDHAGARFDLGEVRYGDRWVTRDEAAALERREHAETMRAHGFVWFHGAWMRPDEVDWRAAELAFEDEIGRLESELAETSRALDGLIAERNDLQAALAGAEGELGGCAQDVAALESRAHELQCEVDRLNGELGQCELALASVPACE